MARAKKLVVLFSGIRVGEIDEGPSGRLVLVYDEVIRHDPKAIPLSISLPLKAARHVDSQVRPYLQGLLPDSDAMRERIAAEAGRGVSPGNPFSLLAHAGEDCAGAVQFVRPERVEDLVGPGENQVDWIDADGIAGILARARQGLPARSDIDGHKGKFSLAGAQPKTALHRDGMDGRWGIPRGRTPTTHILKPPMPGLAGQVENEHFCLRLAGRLGMEAVTSSVMRFGDERAIVVERYDRKWHVRGGAWRRVHQEDMCQALSVSPREKYQNDGGPGIVDIVERVLRVSPCEKDVVEHDVMRFMTAVAYNWIIAGTDAHAKNFSVVHRDADHSHLAPLYDINSALPYYDIQECRMSLKVGGHYGFDLYPRHWIREARTCRVPSNPLLEAIRSLIDRIPGMAAEVALECRAAGLEHGVTDTLAEALAARCARLRPHYA